MNLLIDAQLPRKLAIWLQQAGHDVLHTLDLPLKNRTPDSEINQISIEQDRIVITKDSDFVDSYLLGLGPAKLLLISTGNITNRALQTIFEQNLAEIDESFKSAHFVELTRSSLVIHM